MHDSLRDGETLAHGARRQGDDLLLRVRVIPRASADSVAPEADCLKIRLAAPPVEGKANRRLCKLLAELFGVPKSRVRVEQGAATRTKSVRIVAPRTVPAYLQSPAR